MGKLYKRIVYGLKRRDMLKWVSDKTFIKMVYRAKFNRKLNLKNPLTFNEKLQWLKLNDYKPIYAKMVDKYEAKKYVADIIGEEYIIPTYGVYSNFDEINFDALPNQFVIKCTHDSGGLVICKDKSNFDKEGSREKIEKCLKRNYFNEGREPVYKEVIPRIIVEKYMENKDGSSIEDYKIFCFHGEPKIMYISNNSHTVNQSIAFFDMDYNLLDIEREDYKKMDVIPERPKNFEKMKEFSKILSKDTPHLRVDWYEINGHLYFGELTFITCSGLIPFKNIEDDKLLGSYLDLKKIQ